MTTTTDSPRFLAILGSGISESVKITSGPGKFDLMCSLFDLKKVIFEIKVDNDTSERVSCFVTTIGRAGVSNEDWLVRFKPSDVPCGLLLLARFSSRDRKGTITIVDDNRHMY